MPPVRAHATGKTTASNKKEGKVVRQTEIRESVEFDMEAGNGLASVGDTRGFKKWASDSNKGLTVESTVTVTLTCNQDEASIRAAGLKAGALAEELAGNGIVEMNQYFNDEM